MKGFPNQVADLATLSAALKVVGDLKVEGQNPRDDGVLGEALIRRGVLGTGHQQITVNEYLAQQKTKSMANQSFRTRARGLRELFQVLELLVEAGDDVLLTESGREIAALGDQMLDFASIDLWRKLILNMTHDGGDGEVSHPYQVLLRLVARKPGITRAKCALALEARNDSTAEMERIVALVDLTEDQIREEIGVTKSNWNNAKKILPKFAEQLGDVKKTGQSFSLSDVPGGNGGDQHEAAPEPMPGPRRPRNSRQVTSDTIATVGTDEVGAEAEDEPELGIDIEALNAGKLKAKERRERHNLIVQRAASVLESVEAELFEHPFDCLACFENDGLLLEVKTLDGTEQDEVKRVREALAQLLYYESFVTEPLTEQRTITKIGCFELKISEEHIEWLLASDILTIWETEEGFDGSQLVREMLAGYFGF